jgi:hypothetical protein
MTGEVVVETGEAVAAEEKNNFRAKPDHKIKL